MIRSAGLFMVSYKMNCEKKELWLSIDWQWEFNWILFLSAMFYATCDVFENKCLCW